MKSRMNRRRFFASAAGTGLFALGANAQDTDGWAARHRAARRRKRRIVMNNDGNDVHHVDADAPKTPEYFLSRRTTPLEGAMVDSVFYCDGVFNYYFRESDVSETLYREGAPGDFLRAILAEGTDYLSIVIDDCREHGREIFWSMRMNDTHDSGDPKLDGKVANALEMIEKLAASERAEQVFVRHAFRFWMGRNETLNDRPALIAAHRAYKDNGGSMKALLVSLLTSDAFLYRVRNEPALTQR